MAVNPEEIMNIRILIVDDEADIAQGIHDYLEDESTYNVSVAFSGEEGLERLKKFKPDICIVDMRLPGINGNEYIIKAHEKLPATRFIIHTGSMDYTLPAELVQIGITTDFVLNKPVCDMSIFLQKIEQLL